MAQPCYKASDFLVCKVMALLNYFKREMTVLHDKQTWLSLTDEVKGVNQWPKDMTYIVNLITNTLKTSCKYDYSYTLTKSGDLKRRDQKCPPPLPR